MKKRIAIFAVVLCLFSLLFALPTMAAADGTPPTLKTLTLKATSMKAPGQIEVIGTATDDNSGVNSFWVYFKCAEIEESISCSLSKTYWDNASGKYVEYEDGKYHGFLKADEYQESGTFKMNYVSVGDKAGNYVSYYAEPWSTSQKQLNSTIKALKFTVKATNADTTLPTLKTVTLKKTSMTAPGEIEVLGTATDDNSGVNSFWVYFRCDKLEESISCSLSKTYWDNASGKYVEYADGKYHGFLRSDEHQEAGTFKMNYVSLGDKAGNYVSYYAEPWSTSQKQLSDSIKALKFTVKAGTADTTAPTLKTLTLKTTSMKAPGQIEVIGTATDDDSGVTSFWAYFRCDKLEESISCSLSKTYWDNASGKYVEYADGKYHGFLKADEYQESGTFKMNYVSLGDDAGNYVSYYAEPWSTSQKQLNSTIKALKFNVYNTDAPIYVVTEPKSAIVESGETAKVTVKALGDGLKYTWYYKNKGASKYTKSSITKSTYSTTMNSKSRDRAVYCVIKDKYGNKIKTKTVVLRMAATVTTQPKSAIVKNGATAKVTVKAQGDGLTYTWYIKNKGASKYTKSSITKSTYSTTMNSKSRDRAVYCVVKDKYGNKVKTKTAVLRMAASITTQPKSVKVTKGSTAKVSVKAAGDGLKYTWYIKNKGATKFSKSSVTKSSYAATMSSKVKGRQVYCVVKDKYGKTAKTATVTLNMK